MNWLIDDGSNATARIDTPQGAFEFTYRPATGREVANWLGFRDKLGRGDVDAEFIAKHLVTWPCPGKPTLESVSKLRHPVLQRLADIISGYDAGDASTTPPNPDKSLGN